MSQLGYMPSCPICGASLVPIAGNPYTPPWGCDECSQLWWVSELTPAARAAFRPRQRDWGHPSNPGAIAVRQAVATELEEAVARGVSLRQEQLGLVAAPTLQALLRSFRIAPGFAVLITGVLGGGTV